MDYDDNDFQSQNLHLASEGSAKFPPALRPYALSKFDFDESLQGHLRFDSLVETEVFLGIESNDDNQWIDAYSRGSSGIEFSSSAAESCTISRHNNVWSEATSSESVEMLLKSVGQEEFIPKQTIIEESDACDELASLAKQMEPNRKPDDKSTFIGGGVTDLQLPDRIHESSSGLKEDVGMEQTQTGVSEAHDCELSISGNVSIPELNDICQKVNLPVAEGSLLTDGKSNNENPKDVDTMADQCVDEKPADGSPTSTVQTNIATASMQSISSTHVVLNIQNVHNQVISIGDERQGCLPAKADKQDTVSSTLNTDVDMDNQSLNGNAVGGDAHNQEKPHHSDSKVEALESASVIEGLQAAVSNVEEPFPSVSAGVSELQKTDRETTFSRNQSGDTAGKDSSLHDTMLNDQSDLNTYDLPKAAIKGDTNSEGQVVEFNKSNSGVSPILEQNSSIEIKTYSESSATKVMELVDSGYKMDTKIVVSNSDAHMFTLEDNTKISETNSDRKVGGFSSCCEPFSAKSCISGESTQLSENNEVDRQGEKIHEDVSVIDKESRKPPFDTSQMHSDDNQSHPTGKDVGSSSLVAGGLETKLTTSAVLVDVMATGDSASLVTSENTSLMSGTIDVSPPPRNGVSTHEATDHNEVQKTTPVESVPIEEKEHSVAKIAEGTSICNPVGSSDPESVICPIPGSDKQQSSDTFKRETLNNCLQAVGAGTGNISEPEEKLAGKDIQDCTKDGVSSVICESTAKKGDEVAVSFDKFDKEMTVQETCGMPSLKASGDILLAHEPSIAGAPLPESCVELHEAVGCPATNVGKITCTASTTTEKDGNEVQASADQNCAVSEVTNRDAANVLYTANNPKSNTASKGERSMTPDVMADLSKKDADVTTKGVGKKQSVPATLAGKASTVVEGSPSSSRLGRKKAKGAGDISHGSRKLSDGETTRSVSKGTPERKTRRASNKTAGEESSRKVSRGKGKSLVRQSVSGDKPSNVSLSQSPGFQLMQSNEMQQYGHIDSSSTKPLAFLNASSSGLPDLNTSTPPILFQQPFTDLQQVQLRAQIFVYGALIQGTAPDEAYMISAFGGPEVGRNIWENAWRVCMERQHGQKSHPINPETPKQSRYVKQSTHQGKGTPSPLGRASGKPTTTVVNPLIPLSSPLWSVPTPSDSLQSSALVRGSVVDYPQAVASLHPYQTPPLRNFLGHNASWISQSPLRGPWIASSTPVPDNNSHLSAPPVSDIMKLNSVKESSLPQSSGIKNDAPYIPASSRSPQNTSVGTAPLLDTSNVTPISQHSSDPKPKKRKKVVVSEDHGQKALQSHSQLEAIPVVSAHLSTPVTITAAVGNVPKTQVDKSAMSVSSLSPADPLRNDLNVEKRLLSDESLAKVKEARVHAEEAATLSAAAVSHSLEIWNQLDKQKNFGLVSDIEAKLASAAVAIAAAAAVAKAAAAAANVASNAAVQAKLMANEALASSGFENSCQGNTVSRSEGMINLEKATPASILKGANVISSSSSIILAAKEAARRRVEAASAATKQAENMDAIVKAAELTAEAVSQAGKIVTMGDPLPLSDLIEAGADGYWKAAREYSQQVGLSKDITRGLVNIDSVGDNPETSPKHNRDILFDEMQKHATASEKSTLNKMFNETSEDNMRSITGVSNSMNINEGNSRGPKGRRVSDLVNLVDVVPETEIQASSVILGNGSERLAENNIKEGSLVEVFKDGEEFKAAWFTANVLSLNDGKAHVCYNVLLAEEGSGPLKEWVTLEGEVDKPPIIRMARPLSGLRHEGTRKRRRASMGDYVWSVGDRVDAWLQESWREGVVTEKSKKDETLTVHFPAHGETSVLRAWQLRPSLIWKDGKWIECCRKGVGDNSNHEGDTPHEKRPKLGSPALEAKGKDKMSKTIDAVESDELRLLDLAENEKVFNIGGKTSRNENKTNAQRMVRTGIQKEGSRVIFGVPKPGKKRKFIEVSKHYVADGSNKVNDGNDSVKLANFLMPQGSRSFGWKNSSKNEVKEKRVDSKPKIFKAGKPQNISGRTVPQKENPSANTISHSKDQTDRTEKIKDSVSQFKNSSESGNQMEIPSYSGTEGAAEGPILYSSLATSTDASSKRTSTSRASKGKLAPAGGRLGKIEEEKVLTGNSMKSTTEVIEPRRSNRRIQPTSRLLEGLQSSLIISKIPSVSHDKGHKNQNRNASKKGE